MPSHWFVGGAFGTDDGGPGNVDGRAGIDGGPAGLLGGPGGIVLVGGPGGIVRVGGPGGIVRVGIDGGPAGGPAIRGDEWSIAATLGDDDRLLGDGCFGDFALGDFVVSERGENPSSRDDCVSGSTTFGAACGATTGDFTA